MRKYWLVSVLVLVIFFSGGVLIFGWGRKEQKKIEPQSLSSQEETKEEKAVAGLKDLVRGEATGSAERVLKKEKLFYKVQAKLKKPGKDKFYQVWLLRGVPGEPNFDYLLVGQLKKEKKDRLFSLEFAKELKFIDYQGVLITLEKTGDKIPETHILKGSF